MSPWARLVAVIFAMGTVAACTSSDSASEELAELREDVRELAEQLDERDERIERLADQVTELGSVTETTPPEPPPTTTAAAETGDVEAILPLASELPGDWTEDPFAVDLGVADFGAEPFLTSACGFGAPTGIADPIAVAETAFIEGGPTGPNLAIVVMRFDDERSLARAVERVADETADCDTFFEDPDGRYDISPLAFDIEGATVTGSASIYTPDAEAPRGFAFAGSSHDVVARVGPYLLAASQFVIDGEPDLAATEAAVAALVANAIEVSATTS